MNGEGQEEEMRALEDAPAEGREIIGQEVALSNGAQMLGTRDVEANRRQEPRPEDVPVPPSPYTTPSRTVTVAPRGDQSMALSMLQTPPRGQPRSFLPPLFSEQQLRTLEQGYLNAPLIYGTGNRQAEDQQRQREEDERDAELRRYSADQDMLWRMVQDARAETEVWRNKNKQLTEDLRACEKALIDAQFATPDSRKEERRPEDHGQEARAEEPPRSKDHAGSTSTDADITMKLMMTMMSSMQEMQRQLLSQRGTGRDEEKSDVEWVRSGTQELPKLQEWSASTGPIDFNDWINLLEPQMSDLTSTSGEWWAQLLREARRWYDDHLQLPPLQRMAHDVVPSATLMQKKWSRLEKRASTLLLASLPESQREEMVSARKLSAMQILCQLLVTYQPGGLAEKELILRSLELPPEATSLSEAVIGLRRWARWRRRAMDLGVSEPDPFLLLKGLNRIVRKPLESNRDLSFRISLARSTLQVDATPTSTSITQFSLHLQAELEQVAHLEGGVAKRRESAKEDRGKDMEKIKSTKVKKLEEDDSRPPQEDQRRRSCACRRVEA